jgi:septation ring formation regulator EzrA
MRHTEIMKEINRAYQEGDLARLLEIEQQHSAGEIIDGNSEGDLSRRCQKLEQHNEFLRNQYENLKRELRLAKNSPEGAMVADYRKAAKEGIDPIEQMFTATEQQMQIIEEVRDFVKNFRDKKVTIKEFLQGPECLRNMRRSAMEDLLEEMYGISVTRI